MIVVQAETPRVCYLQKHQGLLCREKHHTIKGNCVGRNTKITVLTEAPKISIPGYRNTVDGCLSKKTRAVALTPKVAVSAEILMVA